MENKKFNREWVKTFAIIFLAILLVLTFFSNTIMNMTLPEVSTEYIQYGSIKTQVRGTGTVTATDNYSVTVPTTREIMKVAVTRGSEVQKGDVLFFLAEGESDELQAARDSYDALNYEYAKMLIDASNSEDFADKERAIEQQKEDLEEAKAKLAAYSGTQTAIDEAKLDVRAAEKEVSQKQKEIEELESEQSALAYTPSEDEVLTGKETDVTLEDYTKAIAQLDAAEKRIEDAKAVVTEKKEAVTTKESTQSKLEREREKLQNTYQKAKSEYDTYKAETTSAEELEKSIESSDQKIDELEHSIKYKQQEFYNQTENRELEKAYDRYIDAKDEYKKKRNAYLNASESDKQAKKEEMQMAGEVLDNAYDYYDSILTNEKNIAKEIEKAIEELELSLKYELKNNTDLRDKLAEVSEREQTLVNMELDVAEKLAAVEKKDDEIEAAKDAVTAANQAVTRAESEYDKAVEEQKKLTESLDKVKNGYKYVKYKDYESKIDQKKEELDALNTTLEEKKEILADLEADSGVSEDSLKEQIKTLERQILSSTSELEKSIEEAGTQNELQKLELEKKKKEIAKAKEEVDKLTEKYTSAEVLAPVSGVIDSINVTAGQKTQPDTALCEISLAEQGFKLTLTVTQEQAAKLRMGSPAEITSYIPYDSKISATLAAIKNDTANPGSRQKLLEFNVEGDVTSGQTLSLAVGDKNASYENTVPNTAIREDSDGKYILIVESQSTPISTRYKAKRVAVTVVASDDTRSAITGDFDSYGYVIATSSKPINSGEQVKLVEN